MQGVGCRVEVTIDSLVADVSYSVTSSEPSYFLVVDTVTCGEGLGISLACRGFRARAQ